jgi:restriction system protein
MGRKKASKQENNWVMGIAMSVLFLYVFVEVYGAWVLASPLLPIGGYLYFRWWKRQSVWHSGIDRVDKMSGREFEEFLGLLFRSHGYKANVTKTSGDYGADLVLRKNGLSVVVQAKRNNKNIGLNAIQEAHAAKAMYKAREAWVVTNRNYTEHALKLAKATGVKLIGRDRLIKLIHQANKKRKPFFFSKREKTFEDLEVYP